MATMDVTEMLTPTETEAAEKWKSEHRTADRDAFFNILAAPSGYGYRIKVVCRACGMREDVTDKQGRDPWPHK